MGTMATRWIKVMVAGLVMAAALTSGAGAGHADTLTPEPFSAKGVDTSVTPGVVGDVIGRFTLANTYDRTGGIPDQEIEIVVKQDTVFYQDFDQNGSYTRSDMLGTVRPDDAFDVFVSGRYDLKAGSYTFFANSVYSPPPPPYVPGPNNQNPAPSLPGDMTNLRTFYVKATVRFTGVRLIPQCCSSDLYGFEVNQIEATSSQHLAQIAAAHGNNLRIYVTPTTQYWGSGKILVDRDKVIQPGNKVFASGRYFWDGIDWRLIATQVTKVNENPAPPGGTLGTTASLVRTSEGTVNTTTQARTGSTYEGRGLNFDGNGNGASLALTLDWTYDTPSASWNYDGTYSVQKDNSSNRLVGTINGTVTTANPAGITGAMIVDQAYGSWAGWTGYGQILRGGAVYAGAPAMSIPASIEADFWWQIFGP